MAAPRRQYKPIRENPREIVAIPLLRTIKLHKICKCSESHLKGLGELNASLPRFGPLYYADHDSSESAKEEAWQQVLQKSAEKEEIVDIYLSTIRRVEKRARATYADEALDGLTESQFRWMMIKDGCFFLQLVLFILGASEQLGYPENHIIFGTKQEMRVVRGWIKSMFYVGNQIPLVILNELMKQTFFQNVINNHGKWERPTDLLSKGVLYDLLIVPAKEYANQSRVATRNTYLLGEQPSDLLHGLQLLVVGPKGPTDDSEGEDEEDEEEGDLEAGQTLNIEVDVGNDKQLCVSGFRKEGIHFKKSNGIGTRGIQFMNCIFFAVLYLPTLKVNRETEILFQNLNYYEITQQQNEVRSYLLLLNYLISTYEDVNHLASKGIIEASKPYYKDRFMRMLKNLNLNETSPIHSHRYIMLQLRDYSTFPWEYFKYVAIIAFILSVVQTIFGVLSYVVGVRQLHQSRP